MMKKVIHSIISELSQIEEISNIFLFGSYLEHPNKAKDIDLVIETNHVDLAKEKIKGVLKEMKIPYKISIDGYETISNYPSFYIDIVVTPGAFLQILQERGERYTKLT